MLSSSNSIQESLKAAFIAAPLPQLLVDANHHVLLANVAAEKMFGYASGELSGRDIASLFENEGRGLPAPDVDSSTDPFWIVANAIHQEGRTFPVEFRRMSLSPPEAKQELLTIRHSTSQPNVNLALQESESQFRSVFHLKEVGIVQLDARTGRYLRVNDHYTEITGYSLAELQKMTPAELTHPEDQAVDTEQLARFFRGEDAGYFNEKRYIRKDGQVIWVQVNASLVFDALGRPTRTVAVVHEITERKMAEFSLRANEECLRQAMRLAHLGIFEHDHRTQVLTFSPELRKMAGWSDDHEVSLQAWLQLVHPQDRAEITSAITDSHRPEGTGRYDVEHRIQLEDGTVRWLRIKAQTFFEEYQGARRATKTIGAAMEITDEREWRRWLQNANDELERKISLRTEELDLERKTALELARKAEENSEALERANTELEQFAYIASHDLQEPLRKIQAFGNLVVSAYGPQIDEQGQDYLQRMGDAAARMQTLINDLLNLSRIVRKGRPFKPVDLSRVVEEVLGDLESRIMETQAKIDVGELPVLDADATQMRQLFQNLIGNALKYIRPGEVPRITISGEQVSHLQGGNGRQKRICEAWRIEVEDRGIGFNADDSERIFQPFQRLHGRGQFEGTGMGLAICRRIVERHDGTIQATGRLNEGSRFIVTLPVEHQSGEAGHGADD